MKREHLLFAAVLLVGALVRLRGLDWGLPWALHIDERLFVVAKVDPARAVAGRRTAFPDPGISSYGILPLWLLVLARKLFLGLAATDGAPIWGDPFAATVRLARWISALWGVVTVVLAWRWAARWGAGVAVVTAALVAGFPALVQASHFGTVEAPLVALIVAGLLAAERLAERPSPARAAVGGAVLGLAISVKAPGALLALPLLHAAWAVETRGRLLRIAVGMAVAAALVVALNPMLLLGGDAGAGSGEHTTLGGNLRRAYSGDFHDWTLPYAKDTPLWTEMTRLLPYAMGLLPQGLALVGLVILLRRRDARDVRLLLVLLPLVALLLPARVKTVRFLLPALPALAVCAAVGTAAIAARSGRAGRAFASAVAGLVLLHGVAFSAIYAQIDPRLAAARWLDDNAGPRDIVVVEDPPGYGPPLGSPSPRLARPSLRFEILWAGFYTRHEKLDEAGRRAHLGRVLERADLLALSEGHRREFTTAPELRPVESGFYADLDAGRMPFERVATFESVPRIGPLVLRDDGAEVLMRVFDHPRIEIWRRIAEESGRGEDDS